MIPTVFVLTESWPGGSSVLGAWESFEDAKRQARDLLEELNPKHLDVLLERLEAITLQDVAHGFHNRLNDTEYFPTTLIFDMVPLHRKNAPQVLENALVGQ